MELRMRQRQLQSLCRTVELPNNPRSIAASHQAQRMRCTRQHLAVRLEAASNGRKRRVFDVTGDDLDIE